MTRDRTILINNIYHMLAYAFRTLEMDLYRDAAAEPFEEMYDLLAAILAKGIGLQLKQGLYREYGERREKLPLMRGKINMPGTIRNYAARERLLTCEYDELSEDNTLNRILKTTALLLIRNRDVKPEYRDELKREMLYFSGIGILDPAGIRWSDIRFRRESRTYPMLIGICRLVIEGMLITTDKGEYRLADFIDEQRMCRLYEKFILEYYRRHFPELSPGAPAIPWCVSEGEDDMLPEMRSDVHLRMGGTVLIIDAKYYSCAAQELYGKRTLHSANLYQIFTYVKNRDYAFGEEEHKVSGMLLYARTGEDVQPDSSYDMHGNRIYARTLDLNKPFDEIAGQLDGIAYDHFGVSRI